MNKIKTACALLLILAVSACSSGGGGGGGGSPSSSSSGGDPINRRDVADLLAEIDGLEDASLADATIPTAGSATLNGYVGVGSEEYDETTFGNLTIEANFVASTVTTRATDFRTFNTVDPKNPVAITGDDQIASGTLSGSGTITGTTMTSKLDGTLTDVGGYNIRVDSTLEGDFYDYDGTLVVYGDVEGSAVSDGVTYLLDDGLFAAGEASAPPSSGGGGGGGSSGGGGESSFVDLIGGRVHRADVAIDLSGGEAVGANTLAAFVTKLEELDAGIDDGSLADATIPTAGSATLNGYITVGYDGQNDRAAFGSLTIGANFGASTVTTDATDFRTFLYINPASSIANIISSTTLSGGTLSGSGTITGTTMSSSLDGTLTIGSGGSTISVETDLEGDFYNDAGTLVVHGTMAGTAGSNGLNGVFAASE